MGCHWPLKRAVATPSGGSTPRGQEAMPNFLSNMEWPQQGCHSTVPPISNALWGDTDSCYWTHPNGRPEARPDLTRQGRSGRRIHAPVVPCRGHTRHCLHNPKKWGRGWASCPLPPCPVHGFPHQCPLFLYVNIKSCRHFQHHHGLVPAQDGPFFYTRSHFSALHNCAVLFSTNFILFSY